MRKAALRVSLVTFIALVIGIGTDHSNGAAQGTPPIIVAPRSGQAIGNRRDFPVNVSIDGYDQDVARGYHYWVSLSIGSEQWPKYYVKGAQHTGRVFDGGENPLPTRQTATILLLKVDGARNQQFIRWLQDGTAKGLWLGLRVVDREIVAKVDIYFP